MAGEYYSDDYVVDYGTTYPESNKKSEGYSGEQNYALGGYSGDQHYAPGDYGTSYSKSMTKTGGNQVSVHQQTYRLKNEDKQSGSYERLTAKDNTVRGEPFVDRYGNRGYKDENTKSSTYKAGDKRGYTEFSRVDKVKRVEYNKKSSSNKAVKPYSKYSKY